MLNTSLSQINLEQIINNPSIAEIKTLELKLDSLITELNSETSKTIDKTIESRIQQSEQYLKNLPADKSKELSELSDARNEYHASYSSNQQALNNYKLLATDIKEKITEIKEELLTNSKIDSSKNRLQKELDSTKSKLETTRLAITLCENSISELKRKHKQADKEHTGLTIELNLKNENLAKKFDAIEKLTKKISQIESAIASMSCTGESEKVQLDLFQTEKKKLSTLKSAQQVELNLLNAEQSKITTEVATKEETAKKLSSQLKTEIEKLSDFKEKLKMLKRQGASQLKVIKEMGAAIEESNRTVTQVCDSVKNLYKQAVSSEQSAKESMQNYASIIVKCINTAYSHSQSYSDYATECLYSGLSSLTGYLPAWTSSTPTEEKEKVKITSDKAAEVTDIQAPQPSL